MEIPVNLELNTICRMCTTSLVDQECYLIDDDLEDLVFLLTTIKVWNFIILKKIIYLIILYPFSLTI